MLVALVNLVCTIIFQEEIEIGRITINITLNC